MEAEEASKEADDEDNEPIEERAYMKGRKILPGQLEDEYPIGLFQTFTLCLGKVSCIDISQLNHEHLLQRFVAPCLC
jgi:hypothetical protein